MNKNEHVAIYKIINVGSSTQELSPCGSINRPMVHGNGSVKKWGDEFIIFSHHPHDKDPSDLTFVGTVTLSKKLKKYLKLFKLIDVPCCNIDYYVISIDVMTKNRIDKVNNFIKIDDTSYSCILSCAYDNRDGLFHNQLTVICQDGDVVLLDGIRNIFDEDLEEFTLS